MILRAWKPYEVRILVRHLKPDWNNFVPTIDSGRSTLRNKRFLLRGIEEVFATTAFFFDAILFIR